jgi:divalent metal cation (Fe/Co/Zn/Cd) transporter
MTITAAIGTAVKEVTPPAVGVAAALGGTGWLPNIGVLIAGLVGLVFGAMWRVSFLRETRKSNWAEVRDDLLNSCFTAGANAVLTIAAIRYFQGDALTAMVIGVCVGGTGVRALMWVQKQVFQSVNQAGQQHVAGPMDDHMSDPYIDATGEYDPNNDNLKG